MSTGLECLFFEVIEDAGGQEVSPPQWYMALERWNAPKSAWDWREFADAFGPFESQEAAIAHLDNFANPGGYSVTSNVSLQDDQVLQGLVENTVNPAKTRRRVW